MGKVYILLFCLRMVTAKLEYHLDQSELVEVMKDLVVGSNAREGIIILDAKIFDERVERMKNKICEGILQNLRSHLITSDNTESLKNLPSRTTNPLIVYVMGSGKTEVETKGIIEKVRRIQLDGRPESKILMTIIDWGINEPISVEFILKHAWSQGILDFTILQVSSTGAVRYDNYNPFNGYRENNNLWKEKGTKFFPNKLINFNGYEMNVIAETCSMTNQDLVPRYCEEDGFEQWDFGYMGIMAIKDALNIKMNTLHLEKIAGLNVNKLKIKDKMEYFYNLMKKHDAPIMVTTSGAHSFSESPIEYSTAIGLQKYCAVVPLLYKNRLAQSITRFLLVLAITLAIVLSFWLIPKLLKFNRHVWVFMNIVRGLLGISWSQNLTRLTERMFYVIMIIGFSRFTFHFYSELVNVIANTQERYKLDSFDDIEASPLRIALSKLAHSALYNLSSGSFRKLLDKAEFQDEMDECLSTLVQFKNVSCITVDYRANLWKKMQGPDVDAQVVISNACVTTVPIVEYFDSQSPYIDRFNNILGRLNAAGLFDKWLNEDLNVLKSKYERTFFKTYDGSEVPPEVSLVKSMLWLYCLPFLVFILELLVYRLRQLFIRNS